MVGVLGQNAVPPARAHKRGPETVSIFVTDRTTKSEVAVESVQVLKINAVIGFVEK